MSQVVCIVWVMIGLSETWNADSKEPSSQGLPYYESYKCQKLWELTW